MLFSSLIIPEDFIVETLALGNFSAEYLHKKYSSSQKLVTIQAMYKALRKLTTDGIILKHKDTYLLNNLWRKRVVKLLGQTDTLPVLQEGESISYSFKSLEQLDQYWKHTQEGALETTGITYLFCPHQFWWFLPGRRESEKSFYGKFLEDKKHAVLLIGGNTAVDKQVKKLLSSKYVQVHAEAGHGLSMRDNLSIHNDLIITTRLPFNASNTIDSIFDQNSSFEETELLLHNFFDKKIPVKIIVERNSKKADKLKKQIGKYFVVNY
jgi:Fe2+ or Zn2+ uptake regulation protein